MDKKIDERKLKREFWLKYLKVNWPQVILAIIMYVLLGLAIATGRYYQFMLAILPVSLLHSLSGFYIENKSLLILREGYERGGGIINQNDATEEVLRKQLVFSKVIHSLNGSILYLSLIVWYKLGWHIGVILIGLYLFYSIKFSKVAKQRGLMYTSHLRSVYKKENLNA